MYLEISNPMDYHVALYIRLSKEDENEGPSESVTNQKSLLDDFVKKHRLSVYDTYIDDGWSGTSFDRPDFQRMIGDIEAKKVNMVITKDLSRLGRDYIMTGHYMERYFPEKRVRYISLLDGIDTGVESSANDITPFRAIMNDMYAKDISKKIKSVKRDKQRKGQFSGGKPMFGYKMHPTEKNQIVVDEEAAKIVRRIFAMALEGVSCRKIATQLNEDHVPTPATYAGLTIGNPGPYTGLWSSERISEMLQNETYIGNMVQGRTVKISYKSKKCLRQARENWVVVEGTHEPLIDAETFQKVQMLVSSRKRTKSRTYDFLLRGLIFCHECGYPMAVINRKNAAGEERLFLICRTYQRFTKAGVCTCHSIKEKTVTDAVLAKVREVCEAYLNPAELLPVAEATISEVDKAASAEVEIQSLRNRIDTLTVNLDKMYMDKLSGILSEVDFQRIYLKVKDDRAQLEEQLKVLEREKREPRPQGGQGKGTGTALSGVRSNQSGTAVQPDRAGGTLRRQTNLHQIPLPTTERGGINPVISILCADLEGAKKTGQTVYNDGSEQYPALKSGRWKNCRKPCMGGRYPEYLICDGRVRQPRGSGVGTLLFSVVAQREKTEYRSIFTLIRKLVEHYGKVCYTKLT